MSGLGSTAVITGATGGIGRSVARALALRGVQLHLLVRDETKGSAFVAELAQEAPDKPAMVHVADLTADLRPLAERLLKEVRSLDILIHAAGTISLQSFSEFEESEFDKQYLINARAPAVLTHLLLPALREARGQIVFVNSSVVQHDTPAYLMAYSASKHALKAVADGIRNAVNGYGIRVLSVYPGRTATTMQENTYRYERRAYHGEQLLQPKDVADAIVGALELQGTAELTELFVRPSRRPS